jgi:hypothetical protein
MPLAQELERWWRMGVHWHVGGWRAKTDREVDRQTPCCLPPPRVNNDAAFMMCDQMDPVTRPVAHD